jgi:hypothetical protein
VPADAWPDPLPPVVQAAIATPIVEPPIKSARTRTVRFLLLANLKVRKIHPFSKMDPLLLRGASGTSSPARLGLRSVPAMG